LALGNAGDLFVTGATSDNAFHIVFDCNVNGIADAQDIASGTSTDSNANGIPDECEHCQTDKGLRGPGTMTLSWCGDPLNQFANASAQLLLQNGPLNGAAVLLFSGQFHPTPIAGAIVGAIPILVSLPVPTDSRGRFGLAYNNPGAPYGVTTYWQFAAAN